MPIKKKKGKRAKSKTATANRAKKAARSKQIVKPRRPKKTAKKRQSKRSTVRARSARNQKPAIDAQAVESSSNRQRAVLGQQSGDLQGLSRAEQADSESVDELVEEGNIFEAGAVAGVEEADNAGEREVHTHEVPEDDVPEEYLDKD